MGFHAAKLKGRRFGKLLVLRRAGRDTWGHILWECRCTCGGRYVAATWILTTHMRTQCPTCSDPQRGYSRKYLAEYSSWQAMKGRCLRESDTSFSNYGGRGIKVCDRWLGPGGFVNFVLDMGRRPKNKTLDRKNPEAGYCPENCKWSTSKQQATNRRCCYTETELIAMREAARREQSKFAVEDVEAQELAIM